MTEDKDDIDPNGGGLPEQLPDQLPIDDQFVVQVEKALHIGSYPPVFRNGELAEAMRDGKLFALEVDRAAKIRAAQRAGTEAITENADRKNACAASRAAQSLERQVSKSFAVIDKIASALLTEDQPHPVAIQRMDGMARLMAASAAAGQVVGRLRDGFSRVERVSILEDRRRR